MKETFESAGEKLNNILTVLESEDTTLDSALKLYAEAAELIAFCNDTLGNAQVKVDEIDKKLANVEVDDGI